MTIPSHNEEIKWPEILSLAGLNAAIVISWIAYHEYQPVLLEQFEFQSLASTLTLAKAVVLVLIPAIAGKIADMLLKKNGKYFTLFTVGIGSTAMIFMAVATIIQSGPLSAIKPFLPFMIVLWLIAMNLFISPANSMIETFAPAKKLPIIMGVLFLTTEIIYSLEPVVIALVQFFGDTMTFIVGAILVGGTGFLFQKISANEVVARKSELAEAKKESAGASGILAIIIVGLVLGLGKAILVEILPGALDAFGFKSSRIISLSLLAFAAVLGFALSRPIAKMNLQKVIIFGFATLLVGAVMVGANMNLILTLSGAAIVAIAFSVLNISGLPFAFKHLSARNVTYGVGIYIGATELFGGIVENIGNF